MFDYTKVERSPRAVRLDPTPLDVPDTLGGMSPNASPMGQVYLGFRSLLVKIVVFVVMAALLAWAIGGTLWPRTAIRIVGMPIMIDGVKVVLVDQIADGTGTFGLATVGDENQILERWPRAELMTPVWNDALSPVATPDGTAGAVAAQVANRWRVWIFEDGAELPKPEGVGGWSFETAGRLEAARLLDGVARGTLPPKADEPAGDQSAVTVDKGAIDPGSSTDASSGPN